jgi:hypothetical protein
VITRSHLFLSPNLSPFTVAPPRNQSVSEATAPRKRKSRSDKAVDKATAADKTAFRARYEEEADAAKDIAPMSASTLRTKQLFGRDLYQWYKHYYRRGGAQSVVVNSPDDDAGEGEGGIDDDGGLWSLPADEMCTALQAYLSFRLTEVSGHASAKPVVKTVSDWKNKMCWLITDRCKPEFSSL